MLGNGDIFAADDALRMVAETGCDGVVVGRGCLGRPWLFGELEAAFAGRPLPTPPNLGEVARVLRRHAELLVEHDGHDKAMRDMRKHMAWYLMGFPVGSELRRGFAMIPAMTEFDDLLAPLDHDAPFPDCADGPPRPPGITGQGHAPARLARRPGRRLRPRGGRHALGRLSCTAARGPCA